MGRIELGLGTASCRKLIAKAFLGVVIAKNRLVCVVTIATAEDQMDS